MARLFTLGRFELRGGDSPVAGVISTQPKRLALLTYLAVAEPRGFHRRDALLALFWPEQSQDEARAALRQALHHLRQALGDDALLTRADDQIALAGDTLWCDVVELERAVSEGRTADAVALYQGEFLDAVFVRGVAPELEEWFDRHRQRIRSLAAEAAGRLAEAEAALGHGGDASRVAMHRCSIDPDNEAALRAALVLLHRQDKPAAAIALYQAFVDRTRERYEVDPSDETASLIKQIRNTKHPQPFTNSESAAEPPAAFDPSSAAPATSPALDEALSAPSPKARTFRQRSVMAGVAIVGTLGLAGWFALDRREAEASAPALFSEQDRIFVADFVNRSRDSTLGVAVAEALRIDLGQSRLFRVLTTSQVRGAVRLLDRPVDVFIDDSLARTIAVREGVKAFVTGDVNAIGSTFVLSARVVTALTGDQLAGARETARDSADLIPAIDRLSRSLRHRIGETLPSVTAGAPLSRVTTSSLPALRKFSQASFALQVTGDRPAALRLLEEAVALDSSFATAWRMLGATYAAVGEPARAAEALNRAFSHRERLPYRERYLTMGSYYRNVTGEYDKAAAAYRALLELYPSDVAGLNNLGMTYFPMRQFARAESLYRRLIAVDSTVAPAYLGLTEALASQGRFRDARMVLDEAGRRFPSVPTIRLTEVYLAASQQDWPLAERHATQRLAAASSDRQRIDALQTLAQIELVTGKLSRAEQHLDASLQLAIDGESPRKFLYGSVVLGWLELRYRNRPVEAARRVDGALARYPLATLAVEDRPYVELGQFLGAIGRPGVVRQLLTEADRDGALGGSDRQQIDAAVSMAEQRPREAADALTLADRSADCPICVLPDLARAHALGGDLEAAIAVSERYLDTSYIWRFEPDAPNLGPLLLEMGAWYEQQRQPAKAAGQYRRLLRLWSESDAELAPRLADVRARLVRLEGNQ